MRIGLMSFDHLHAFSYLSVLQAIPQVECVGVTDQDPERGAQYAREWGVAFIANPDDLLDRVDAVIITSANADHRAMALRAAEAGVAALVEKPIATTIQDAQAIIDTYQRSNLTLGTAFPCPFSPAFESLQQTIRTGELGNLLAARTTNRGKMPGGFFIQLERSGGGAVIDHTVHVADLLRRLIASEAVQVYAEIGHGLYHQEWDDSGLLTIEFENGCFATLDCSWSRPASYPTWGDVKLHVVGEKGNASADLYGQHVHLYPFSGTPTWRAWGSDLDVLMIADFCHAVAEHRPPRSTGVDGLRALEIALAAYQSAKQKRPIRLEEIRE